MRLIQGLILAVLGAAAIYGGSRVLSEVGAQYEEARAQYPVMVSQEDAWLRAERSW
jgi:hypothetical protein